MNVTKCLTVADFEKSALEKLGPGLADYVQKTAGEGKAFRSNLHAYSQYRIGKAEKVTVNPHTGLSVFDRALLTPIMIAPTAWHGMFTPRGEAATSDAAERVGTNFVISSFSTFDFYQISTGLLSHAWYQLLMYKDLDLMKRYIDRAIDVGGCSAIVITIDAVAGCSMCKKDPAVPAVEFPLHNLPLLPQDPALPYSSFDDYYEKYMPMKLDWEDVRKIVSHARVPVVIKGVISYIDILDALKAGAKAVIVSNHGGRQDDGSLSTLEALSRLPWDTRHQIDIYLDGGIRCGSDVFKAIGLGAKAVFIGRPALYGLAVNGSEGLVDVLEILTDELKECMRDAGCNFLSRITQDKVVRC
jgi:(S)-2-hydroxy-acid oxidase